MLENIPSVIGKALSGVRPGVEAIVAHKAFAGTPESMVVQSDTFGAGQPLPIDCTEDGATKGSPPLAWQGAPAGTAEVVMIVEDADSPTPHPLVHAILYGLPAEGALPANGFAAAPEVGETSMGQAAWLPPDPPSGHGPHRYVVQVFALGQPSGLEGRPGRTAVVEALQGKVLAKGLLIGTYERR